MSRKRPLSAAETLICPITSAIEPVDLKKLFPVPQPMELELGCGDGSFTLQYALENPKINIVALERLLGRITKLNRKAHRAELKNLRLLRAEARYVLEYLLIEILLKLCMFIFLILGQKSAIKKIGLLGNYSQR